MRNNIEKIVLKKKYLKNHIEKTLLERQYAWKTV